MKSIFRIISIFFICIAIFAACSQGPDHMMREDVVYAPPPSPSPASAPLMMKMSGTPASAPEQFNTEQYNHILENTFKSPVNDPLSTFSIDVDTASYSNVRRFLNQNTLPPADAVRIEELINYFSYNYPEPKNETPFSVTTEVGKCLWNREHKLIHIGIKGKDIPMKDIPGMNLVFLLDVSGSMNSPDKLPLLKKGFKLLVNQLREKDSVAIAVYAGATGLVLPPTPGNEKTSILRSIEKLEAGGSTAGAQGIELAYKTAKDNYIENGNNRVILATDGDFNVGVSSDGELVRMIEEKRKQGIFLSVLGFGTGNIKDSKMEQLADKGNGNYAYIDSLLEAKKVLVKEMGGTLFAIAKDVKIQVEFNPAKVKAYRLIGYENRLLNKEDFNDDKKDAGELGAGHTVTALYEIIPAGSKEEIPGVDDLKYQKTQSLAENGGLDEIMNLKLRYKLPRSEKSKLLVYPVKDKDTAIDEASENFMFSASVAGFGMLLRKSEFSDNLTYKDIIETAKASKGKDENGYRAEFIRLAEQAEMLDEK